MIITANMFFNMPWEQYKQLVIIPETMKQGITLPHSVLDDKPLEAEINHGRWIVKCECGGAEKAWEEGLFMCQSCWNGGHKHQYRKMIFPRWRKQVEGLLEKRPLQNRNWTLGETLAQLRTENKEHQEELL